MKLGNFQILCGKIMISDPCYEVGISCQQVVDAKNGNWAGDITYSHHENRVGSLSAYHENYDNEKVADTKVYDNLGVDSGQLGFFDLIKYRDDTVLEVLSTNLVATPLCPKEPWYSLCCDRTLDAKQAGIIPYGIVSSSGYGDGSYTAEVDYNKEGQAIGIRVTFIEDDVEDEEFFEDEE